jgi:hypothetical protein
MDKGAMLFYILALAKVDIVKVLVFIIIKIFRVLYRVSLIPKAFA